MTTPPLRTQLRNIVQTLGASIDEAVKLTVLEIQYELKRATPVDTGHARSNWVPSIGAPHTTEEEGAGGGAQTAGEGKIATYKKEMGAAYISNNVPYIQRLDQGHSKQAPMGFVQGSITRGVRKAQAKLIRRRGKK